jgi:hypothetical protein
MATARRGHADESENGFASSDTKGTSWAIEVHSSNAGSERKDCDGHRAVAGELCGCLEAAFSRPDEL